MSTKKEKTCKFEEDLYYYVKIRKKNRESFKKFPELYNSFISKNAFDYEELKTGKIKFKYTNEFESYILNNSKELSSMLGILESFDSLNLRYIKNIIVNYLITFRKPWTIISKINSKSNLMNVLISIINKEDIITKSIFEFAIKTYMLSAGNILKNKMEFIDKAYDDFNQYFNLTINKELISDELIDRISMLMMNQNFTIPSDTNDEKDPVTRLLKYTADFANYTKFHNLTVTKNRELQATKEFEKTTNKMQKALIPSKNEANLKTKVVIDDESIALTNDDTSFNKEEVDNMVKSFLPSICTEDRCCVEDDMLPSKYDPNYNDIIIGLLKAYEEHTSNLEECTMKDFNKYNDLLIMVEQIKTKS